MEAVEVPEDAVLVFEHRVSNSQVAGLPAGVSRTFAAAPGFLALLSVSGGPSLSPPFVAIEPGCDERARAADRRGEVPVDLRTRLGRLAVA